MIHELIVCDLCHNRQDMRGSVVPEAWLSRDGKHFCSTFCFMVAGGGDQ